MIAQQYQSHDTIAAGSCLLIYNIHTGIGVGLSVRRPYISIAIVDIGCIGAEITILQIHMNMAYTITSGGTTISVGIIARGSIGNAIVFYGRAFTYLQLLVELIGGIDGQVKSIDTIVTIVSLVGVLVCERA